MTSVAATEGVASQRSRRLVPLGGNVCIIGGGTTGLLAAKNCLDEGLVPTVFERTTQVGGVWRLDSAPHRVAYESLYTNSSGSMMNISDFPLGPELQGCFPGRQDICKYYERYTEELRLKKYVRFSTEVTSVRRSDACWEVEVADVACEEGPGEQPGRVQERLRFDAVFVCTGQFREPACPPLIGREAFKGRVRHSAEYRNAEGLRGRRVLIVGIGNSALDISLEAARAGAVVTVLCRSGVNVIPVADAYGRPVDQALNTRLYNALPGALRGMLLLQTIRGTNDEFRRRGMPAVPTGKADAGFANLKEHIAYRRFLAEGKISFESGSIKELRAHSVMIDTGKEIAADELILCTGYNLTFSFLSPEVRDTFIVEKGGRKQLNAYRLIMHPSEPTLCALSFLLTFGNESCVGEMQARWALALWAGRIALPTPAAIAADVQRRLRSQSKYSQFVPYVAYMDGLAADCGAAPPNSWVTMLKHPSLAWKLWTAPVVPAQYRLSGPNAWQGAADFVRTQPTTAFWWASLLLAPPHRASVPPRLAPVRVDGPYAQRPLPQPTSRL